MKRLSLCLAICLLPAVTHARAIVVKKVVGQPGLGKQTLTNGDLEKLDNGRIVGLTPWDKGYTVDSAARSGQVAARCDITNLATDGEKGATYLVALNQKQPLPFTCELWSKAKEVSGGTSGDYSLYVDLTHMDGTPLWGQLAAFATGTHDWQRRTVTVVPQKPVKEVQFHAIFRRHTGTAWFDDFACYLVDLPGGCGVFDGIAVARGASPKPSPLTAESGQHFIPLGEGVTDKIICLDDRTGQWMEPSAGGLFLRDAKAKSDFRQPLGRVRQDAKGRHFEGTDEELGLKLVADYRGLGRRAILIEGYVEDLRGEDRGVSVYCSLGNVSADTWHDDMRNTRRIAPGQTYSNCTQVGCGANGKMSHYPFGCVSAGGRTVCVAAPLDPARLFRFAYDSGTKELYGVEDLGLSRDFKKSPGRASFAFVVNAVWDGGFRGILDEYYKLFPDYFVKRNKVEGNWVAFDDIAPIQGFEDFGIAFKEGTNNPACDEAHGILTYTYVEPTSYWMSMYDQPRTPEAAMAMLSKQAAEKQIRASATMNSGLRDSENSVWLSIENAPWCDGALFLNNPDPDIPTTEQYPINQGQVLWRSINSELSSATGAVSPWRFWGEGYEAAPGKGRNGTQAALCDMPQMGENHGLAQTIALNQERPGKVIVRAWSKAENVTGEADNSYCIYCDVTLKDGTPRFAQLASFSLGTHDWEQKEVVINLDQPITTLHLHLLFRNNHSGKVWFDDASVRLEGSERELLENPGLEPTGTRQAVVDGTYIDSLEMGGTALDFDRRHWAAADVPLVYTTMEGLPVELLGFGTYEFVKDVSEKMHAQGRTIMANSVLHQFPQPAAVLDVFGTETNWHSGGNWTPMTDADCNFKRAMCYQRPYLLLQNTVFEEFPVAMVERYMRRAIFYGMAPSFFSHNAASATYWSRPDIYNRDRHLFKRYLPVYKALAAAGWEPLTWATTGNAKVYVERYGKGDEVYFALFNDSDRAQDFRLTVDLKALSVSATGLHDVLAGTEAQVTAAVGNLELKDTLAAEDLRVLKVVRP